MVFVDAHKDKHAENKLFAATSRICHLQYSVNIMQCIITNHFNQESTLRWYKDEELTTQDQHGNTVYSKFNFGEPDQLDRASRPNQLDIRNRLTDKWQTE